MNRAQRKAAALRRKLGLHGRVDAESVAGILGLEVVAWPMRVQQEMQMGLFIGVAERLDARWRRWVIAHAIGHRLLHSGNHLWIRGHTSLNSLFEREAEDFARALLTDLDEVMEEGLSEVWEVAEHFGVPEEMVWLQSPLLSGVNASAARLWEKEGNAQGGRGRREPK